MTGPNIKDWSQRQQVLAVILMGGGIIFLLWFFLLTPLNRKRIRLEKEISNMQSQLERKNLLLGENVLRKTKAAEQDYYRKLYREWTEATTKLSAFEQAEDATAAEVGHIDYKVELFNVKRDLMKKARDAGIVMPGRGNLLIGMDEAVSSNEDARKLMLQLRTVKKLVDLFLDMRIKDIKGVKPLPPVPHYTDDEAELFLEEYPVSVEFFSSLQELFELLETIAAPGNAFAVRRFRIAPMSAKNQAVLRVTAEMSGLVFVKTPDELAPIETAEKVSKRPKGF